MPYQFPAVVRRRALLRGLLAAGSVWRDVSVLGSLLYVNDQYIKTPVRGNDERSPPVDWRHL
jgi:hypothetical protein